MLILGIETSCDETAASLVKDGVKILSNIVASSQSLHKKTGGIVPEVAAREQVRCIIPVVEESVKVSGYQSIKEIDAIAVTVGPGLIGSLLVGVETAKTLAYVWEKPIVPVNHLIGHIYANFVNSRQASSISSQSLFPAVALVVSGGHTDLVLMQNHGDIRWLGGTRDDAAGEAFDKVARILGLSYPGGPAIEACASRLKTKNYKLKTKLPRPMINTKDYDFSFSGLKTAVLREVSESQRVRESKESELAASFQEAVTDVLAKKTISAAREFGAKSILLGGGVAANKVLREKIGNYAGKMKVKFFYPPINLCIDNAAMIASTAFFNFKPLPWQKIKADPSLSIEDVIK